MSRPLLVVVTGMPAACKTTLARALVALLKYVFEGSPVFDRIGGPLLGVFPLIFLFVRRSLAADRSVIAEANFSRGTAEPHFHALPPHRTVQIHCHAPLDVLLARYGARPVRHPGHLDGVRAGELVDRFADDAHGPLALDGELIELDTSRPVDVEALAERLRRLL